MDYPVPKRLSGILKVTDDGKSNEKMAKGKLKCSCGCESFAVSYFGKQGAFSPAIGKAVLGGSKRSAVYASCKLCGKKVLLFDSAKDGLAMQASPAADEVPYTSLTNFKCGKCKENSLSLTVEIHSNGKAFDQPGVTEDNWKEGFTEITVDAACNTCGRKYNGLLHETE